MFYVYLLQNLRKQIYIGYSANLKQRIADHNSGKSAFTKIGRPWKLVYYESYLDEGDARGREAVLKNYGSTLGQLKKRIAGSLEC